MIGVGNGERKFHLMAYYQTKDHWSEDDDSVPSHDVAKERTHDDRTSLFKIAPRLRVDAFDYEQEQHSPGK